MAYLLGIDIGTTTVKTVLVNSADFKVVEERSTPIGDHLESSIPDARELSASATLAAVERCASGHSRAALQHVRSIGVCGQMHGCVLWKDEEPFLRGGELHAHEPGSCGVLITWQDKRCSEAFLTSLPSTSTSVPVSAGYGCATLAWLQRYCPEDLARYNRAGTIMDLLVWSLCGKLKMSDQNATSWGFYDPICKQWDESTLLQARVPTKLLPPTVSVPHRAGTLLMDWLGIREAQLVVIYTDHSLRSNQLFRQSLTDVPYFSGDYAKVAASLSGGNVIATFVCMLQGWLEAMGIDRKTIGDADIYERLMTCGAEKWDTTLCVDPVWWGERHTPEAKGSVTNMAEDNMTFSDWCSALHRGIVQNLSKMMPEEVLLEHKIERLLGSGRTLHKNTLLQRHVTSIFKRPLVLREEVDSPLGAAMAVSTLCVDQC
eukprot:Em0015g568a